MWRLAGGVWVCGLGFSESVAGYDLEWTSKDGRRRERSALQEQTYETMTEMYRRRVEK